MRTPPIARMPLPFALLAGAVLTALVPARTPAQTPAPAASPVPSAPAAPDTVVRIAPVLVDVLRTPLAGTAVPFAIATVDLQALPVPPGGAFLSDALAALPGLQLQNRFNFAVGERVVVRGFGSRAQFGVRGIRAVLDGIPATLPDGQTTLDHVDPAALGRVELLRGPGSAWWGNAAGGVLFLRSRTPEPGRRVETRIRSGEFGLREASVVIEDGGNAPGSASGPGATTRVGVTGVQWEGFRTNPLGDGTYGDADRWIVTGTHRRALAGGDLTLSLAALDLDSENPGSLPLDSLDSDRRPAWGSNVRQQLGKTVRQAQLGAAWTGRAWDPFAGSAAFLGPIEGELAAWAITRDFRNPIPGTVVEVDRSAGGARLGLSSRDGAVHWAVGFEAEVQRDDRRNFVNEAGANGTPTLDQDETVLGTALFARTGAGLGRVDLQAAVRWDRIRFEAKDRFLTGADPDDSGERTMSALNPSLGLRVALSRRDGATVDLFTSGSAFMETPTTTELANRPDGAGGFNPSLEPTRGWTAEVGLQGTVGRRIGWELVGFRTALRDELVPFEVAADPGRTYYRNAAESSHEGLEASVRVALPADLALRSAFTLVDARFGAGQAGDLEGNRIPGRAPGRFEARLSRATGRLQGVLDVTWSDAVPANDANSAEAPSWWRVDLRVGPPPITGGRWQLTPWIELGNLLDERYVGSVVVNAFGGRFHEPAAGRSLSLGTRVIFRGN